MSSSSAPQQSTPSRVNVLARLKGVFVVIGSIGCGGIGWIALAILRENIRNNPESASDMPPMAVRLIQQPMWLLLVAAAALAAGMAIVVAPRSRAMMWLLFMLGMGCILITFGAILYCFLSFMAPMYEYKPL